MSSHRTDRDFERVLDAAVAAGKFSEARKEHYRGLYQRDPGGTRQAVAALHAGDPRLVAALAGDLTPEDSFSGGDSAYPAAWLPELNRPGRRAEARRSEVRRSSRMTSGTASAATSIAAAPPPPYPPAPTVVEAQHLRPVQPEARAATQPVNGRETSQEDVQAWVQKQLPETARASRPSRITRADP